MNKFINNKDRVGSLLILTFSMFYLRYIFVIPVDPTVNSEYFSARTFPFGLSIVAILLSLVQIIVHPSRNDAESISASVLGFFWKPLLWLIGLMTVYSLTFSFLGFSVSTFLFLFCGFVVLGERRWFLSLSVAAGLVLFIWYVLTQLFGLYLDSGDLFRLFVNKNVGD